MTTGSNCRTDQEKFWAGDFGTSYIARNQGPALLASNLALFGRALAHAGKISTCIEFGASIGLNLRALLLLFPELRASAVEINPTAAAALRSVIGPDRVVEGSILEHHDLGRYDLALAKGVLIHIAPDSLPAAYERLHEVTGRYLLVAEYYSPTPVAIPYRGHADRLFKRDFAGEILDAYPDLRLVDYGFAYHRDPAFAQDDLNWFLLERIG